MTGPVTPVIAPHRSPQPAGRDGFAQLVHAEWTKLRTVRGWVIALFLVIVLTDLIGILATGSSSVQCTSARPGAKPRSGAACAPKLTTGPGGEAVDDTYYLVGRPLSGNGSLTARVTGLTTEWLGQGDGGSGQQPGPLPWAKGGLIITASTRPGAAYAAMMVTPDHGVRMQSDYTGDLAGMPGTASAAHPRWLRLTRSGGTITGYDSADGVHWTTVGRVQLPGLATARAGLFTAAPGWERSSTNLGGGESGQGGPGLATAVLDRVSASGTWSSGQWQGTAVGGAGTLAAVGYQQAGGQFTVKGSGDIAPQVPGTGDRTQPIERHLVGAFAGLIAVIVVAVMFITAEYRRGLIRTTLTASPRRGRLLAAKALVIAMVTFVTGLAAAAIAVAGGRGRGAQPIRRRVPGDLPDRSTDRGRHRAAAGGGGRAGGGRRCDPAPHRRRSHHRHRGHRAAVHPRGRIPAALGRGGLAAARHPRGRVRDPAEHPRLPAGGQLVRTHRRLLPAGAVGRVRGAVRLDRARLRPGRDPDPAAGRMRDAR
ncbi:MAG TPA: hypothetical protein VG268_16125 [Streptosporangiaceae bacterium]|nr:hypothetical protein [Streptosporangiaceae bacterium]